MSNTYIFHQLESRLNVMARCDAREGKWRGNCRMECVASTLHTTSEHGVSSITTADAHTSAASSRLNWRPRRFKWTRPFRRKTISGFCACAITFQTQSTHNNGTNIQYGCSWLQEWVLTRRISIHKGTVCVSCELMWIQNRTQLTEMFAVGDRYTSQPGSWRKPVHSPTRFSLCGAPKSFTEERSVSESQWNKKKSTITVKIAWWYLAILWSYFGFLHRAVVNF